MPVPQDPRGAEAAASGSNGSRSPRERRLPYWRLSAFYFFFFAVLGALLPYWSLYLQSLGFRPLEVGALFAVMMATKIVAPNVWGWLGDRTGRRMAIVRWASVAAAAAFSGALFGTGFWWLVAVVGVFSFFWNAALPQFEAVTLNHLGEDAFSYSRIRLWGSVGFIASVYAVGRLLDAVELTALPWIVLLLVSAIAGASLAVSESPGAMPAESNAPSLASVIARPTVCALLAACFLMQASHGPYYVFFSIQMEAVGHSRQLIGALWSLGVIAEVILFVFVHRLMPRLGLRTLFLASFAATAIRWLLLAFFAGHLWVVLGSQLLHAATFGIYHAVAIQLVHRYFVSPHQGRGQALYSSMSFGAGGATGSFLSGISWEAFGAQATWLGAALISLIAALVVLRWLDDPFSGEKAKPPRALAP